MKYPRYLHTLSFHRVDRQTYEIKEFYSEETWTVSADYARFLRALDGRTDPYKIYPSLSRGEVRSLLAELESEELLDDGSRFMHVYGGMFLFRLWSPIIHPKHRKIAAIWNRILMLTWLPVLIAGICLRSDRIGQDLHFLHWILSVGIGMLVCLLLHELCHTAAAIGYSKESTPYEIGIMVQHFVIPGAYVLSDTDSIKDRFKQAQVDAAGVECNALIAGLALLATNIPFVNADVMFMICVINLTCALINTSLIDGFDGAHIFSDVFGCPNVVDRAKHLLKSKKLKKRMHKKGLNGRLTLAVCRLLVFFQILLPLCVLLEVLSVGIIVFFSYFY